MELPIFCRNVDSFPFRRIVWAYYAYTYVLFLGKVMPKFSFGMLRYPFSLYPQATMVRMMSEGVVARFLKAATAEMIRNNQKEIRCPCRRCKLTSLMDPKDDMVRDHLLMRGFMDGYRWEGDEDDYEFVHGISTRNKEGGDQDVEDLGHDRQVGYAQEPRYTSLRDAPEMTCDFRRLYTR